jgi:hypothetical protein
MRLVRLRVPGGLENLKLVEEDHPKPRLDKLLVKIRGQVPVAAGRPVEHFHAV